jgi:hypothetical protein
LILILFYFSFLVLQFDFEFAGFYFGLADMAVASLSTSLDFQLQFKPSHHHFTASPCVLQLHPTPSSS